MERSPWHANAPLRLALWLSPGLPWPRNLGPVEDHFAGPAALHRFEAVLELLGLEAVGDHLRHVEARLEQRGHLVPGLEHLAAVDALDDEAFEDHVIEI